MLSVDDEIKEIFLAQLKDILINGKIKKVEKKKKTTRFVYQVRGDQSFKLIGKEETESVDVAYHHEGVPPNVLQIIYDSLSLDNAINLLEQHGYKVYDPSQIADEKDKQLKGVSDDTLDLIATKVLGIENEATN